MVGAFLLFNEQYGYNSGMEFAWDPAKAIFNLRKHGVAFSEAAMPTEDMFANYME